MIKLILIFFSIFLLIFFLSKKNFKIRNFLIILFVLLIIYLIYSGKVNFLLPILKSLIPNLMKLLNFL